MLWQTTDIATHDEQVKLQLPVRASVMRGARLRANAQQSSAYELVSVRALSGSLVDIHQMASQMGMTLGQATEKMSAAPADSVVSHYLGVPLGTRVMLLDRIVLTDKGLPFEWRIAYVRIFSGP